MESVVHHPDLAPLCKAVACPHHGIAEVFGATRQMIDFFIRVINLEFSQFAMQFRIRRTIYSSVVDRGLKGDRRVRRLDRKSVV